MDDSDTVHLVASNVRPSEVARTLGHEIIGHKGLRAVFGEQFDSLLDQVYRDHFEEVAEAAQRYHRDTETLENQRYLTEEFLADCANAEVKPSWWKEFLGFVRQQLRKILPEMRFSDTDIEAALSRSARAMRKRGGESNGSGVRFAAALRREGAPNTAEQSGLLRDNNVPYADGFLEWTGLKGTRLYADYEFLYGRHPQYFDSPEMARAAVELVLSNPEKVQDINGNLSFAGFDEETGAIYRIEIDPAVKNKYNHIRSVFEITGDQYNKIKLADSPVLQLSPTKDQNQLAGRTLASFLRYDSTENGNVKFPDRGTGRTQADGEIRFAAALRREGAPNTADQPGQLRDSHVPYRNGFMEEYGFGGKGLYADYEFLFGRHPEYFEDAEHVRAAAEFVLDDPEPGGHILGNLTFIRKDASTGKMFRIEISPEQVGKRHQIRSVHEITEQQYKKIKDRLSRSSTASPDPVRHEQTLKTGGHPNMKGVGPLENRTVSDFLRYDSTENGNVKFPDGETGRTQADGADGAEYSPDPESGKVFPLRMENSYQSVHRVLREMQGKTFRNADTGIEAKLSNTGVNKLLSNKARAKSAANGYTDAQHLQAAANVDRLFENSVLLEDRADRNNDPNIASIKRFAAPFYTNGDFAEALITLKESVQNGARIYSLELNEIRKPSSPDKWGLENQANTQALDGYNKLQQKIEKARALLDKKQKNMEVPAIRFSLNQYSDADMPDMAEYSLETAAASKAGYRVERVNENAGREFNAAKGVICVPGEELNGSLLWSKEQWREFMTEKDITGMHHVPALNAEAEVRNNLPKRLKGHSAFEEKMNLISVIPEMLNDAVLIQQERKGELNSYILAAKVRYGEGENARRFIAGIVIHQDNQGKLYYDHELTEIEKAAGPWNRGHNPADPATSVNNVIQNALFASGFDKKDGRNIRFSLNQYSDADWPDGAEYLPETAVASKAGYRVERVNENAGREFNNAKGVTVQPEMVYKRGEVPKEQPRTWLRNRCVEYVQTHHILGEHDTPALGDGVKVTVGSVKAVLNHPGSDIKNNLIAVIPDLLKDAVLIQTESNGKSKTYLLAAKVRYGENTRFIAGMVIHENQGKFYYDHELVEIENADIQSSLPMSATGVGFESASVINVIQNALFASGFDKKDGRNVRFAVGGDAEFYGNGLCFSLGVYSEADQKDIVAMLKPYTGQSMERTAEEYAKHLAEKGVNIPAKDAWVFAVEACRENQEEARQRGIRRRDKWLYDNTPLYREIVDFAGENFIIKPAYRFTGEAFSGAWISPEFRKYSEKRPQGKKESDSSYRRYLAKREKALANATGHDSDEIAEAIARKRGRDPLDVEQEMIDFFRDLSKKEFYHRYTEWKQENIFADEEARKRAMDEWMKQEQAKIEDEVVALLEKGHPITEEWVRDNRKVYNELYKQLFSGKEAPCSPGKKDLEAINAALMQEGANASTFAEAYKTAREKAYGEFMSRLADFRDRVMHSKANAVKLQREALDFAEKNLPAEYRGEFARNIVSLLEYPTSPSGKYPEGRRMHEFRNLFDRIVTRAGEVRKNNGVSAIKEMLDAAKIKRNYKGIPTSVLPPEQGKVDRIRQVVNMNLPTLLNAIEYNSQEIMNLEGDGEKENLLEHYLEDNRILEMFGNLEHRSADDVEAAAKQLETIIKGGKAAFRDALTRRRAEVDALRKRAVNDATFGKNRFADRGDAKKHSGYWLKNESLGTLMRIASGSSIQDFDNSAGGELYRKVEDSTQTEQTALRHLQQDFDAALRDLAGITGNKITAMRKKGKFFRMLSEVAEHTGVFKTEYTRQIKTGVADFVEEEGRRGFLKKSIPVEDYEWGGKMHKGARSILRDIDNGSKNAVFDYFIPDDVSVAFLRQQLADYDAGLKQSYEVFNDESDDANFNRMLEEERQSGRLVIFTHLPEEEAHTVEVPLSQGAALQILLTWEQEHYQPNMKWNGWTEKSIEQLKKFIKPEVLKMGYWMRDAIAKNKPALDEKVYERYGAHLPLTENYFPAAFRSGKTKAVRVDSELGRGAGAMSINPDFLIARKFHLKPVDTDADAFSSFMSNQIEQSHFLSWSDTVRDLKAVYGGTMVQKAIADNFGREVVNNLVERVGMIARGGGRNGEYAARLMQKLYRHWVPAKIALNPSSLIKQMAGTAAYMNNVPVKDFVSYFAKANFSNPDYRAFVAWAKNTDYMKNRLAGGLDKDLSYLLNYTRDSKAYSPWSDALLNFGTWGTRYADAWSALHGGYAAYMYALDQARQAGSTEGAAREAARRAWMRATDETQQSGYLKDQNYFQSNQGAYRYLTAFMTNPIQIMNLQLQTINEIRYGPDKKAAWQKLGRQVLVNHIIVPTLMLFTTDMLRYGFNLADWWDEAEFEDYLFAWMLGSFESAFCWGKMISNTGGYALDRIFDRKMSFGDSISAMPLAEDLKRDTGLFIKLAEGEKPLTEKELMDSLKALGDAGMIIGVRDSRIGTAGAMLHAAGTQGKRLIRWFNGEK